MNLVIFGTVLIVIAAAFAVPVLRYSDGRVNDANAVVLASAILSGGLGSLNLVFLGWTVFLNGESLYGLLVGLAPVAAALLAAHVVWRRRGGLPRALLLISAAVLVLAGLPAYFAFAFAAFVALIAAVLYLLGIASPAALFKTLDPRN